MYPKMNQEPKTNVKGAKILGYVSFVVGVLSTYFSFPVDHPLWFDASGLAISTLLVVAPGKAVESLITLGEEAKNKIFKK